MQLFAVLRSFRPRWASLLTLALLLPLVTTLLAPALPLHAAATLIVTNGNDSGPGSLRQAIADADNGDEIEFDEDVSVITLTTEPITITQDLTIAGSGADQLTIQRDIARPAFRIFAISSGADVTIQGVTIANGWSPWTVELQDGGGIYNEGTLTLEDSTLLNNSAERNGGGVYNLGTLTVRDSTFNGNGASGGLGGGIYNDEQGTLTVESSTFSQNGVENSGGALYNRGTASVTESIFQNNAVGDSGAGIANFGTLTVEQSHFENNFCADSGGGAISNFSSDGSAGSVTVQNSTFSNNEAEQGGAIITFEAASTTIINSTFTDNIAEYNGGALWNYLGTVTVQQSTFTGNKAVSGGAIANLGASDSLGTLTLEDSTISRNGVADNGGGIYNDSRLTVRRSTINNNGAEDAGGGIYNHPQGILTVEGSTFYENAVEDSGGAISNLGTATVTESTFHNNGVDHSGAAITNEGTLTVELSYFHDNAAPEGTGGAISNFASDGSAGTLTVRNSTLSNNEAEQGGAISTFEGTSTTVSNTTFIQNRAEYDGGAIWNDRGAVTVQQSTFSGNSAATDSANGAGGGIYNTEGTLTVQQSTFSDNSAASGGGIANLGTLDLTNTILANSRGGGDCVTGTISTNRYNLIEDGSCSDTAIGLVTGDPRLGPLADNGGPTATYALLPGSPAINAGDPAFTPPPDFDQRGAGFPRVQQGQLDIGAVESDLRPVSDNLFISEYVEGTGRNRAIELYNGTGEPIDLVAGGYCLVFWIDGDAGQRTTLPIGTGAAPDTLAPGEVYVVAQAGAGRAIRRVADQLANVYFFSGDDAVVLHRGGCGEAAPVVDAIGQAGVDPGTEWGRGLTSTNNNTLRRKPTLCTGDTNATDAFDPASEWEGFAENTFGGLGSHMATCSTP